jgi:pterin-4a-carbinolamine dehydratase
LDDPNDWVRNEHITAIERKIAILPLTLDDASIPPPEALDKKLEQICSMQTLPVRVSSWENDLHEVIKQIKKIISINLRTKLDDSSLNPNGTPIPRPDRKKNNEAILAANALRQKLDDIPPWQFQTNYHPWAIGGKAEEIARIYEFCSFENATQFMADSAKAINHWRPPHHPRWENQWRVVKVWFSTWDVGCRVTQLDIDAAKKMEALFRSYNRDC